MNHPTIAALTLATVLFASGALSQDPVPDAEPALLQYMEGMKTHMKGAAMALQDAASKDQALEHIAELQRLVLLAKLEAPANLAATPEAERAAHRADFRRDLTLVLRELVEMELSVLDGKNAEAFARVVKPLYPMREAAHAKYQSKD